MNISIYEYLEEISPVYANNFHLKISNLIELIQKFPEMGRTMPEINQPSIKEVIWKKYRIIYSNRKEDIIEILAIVHGNRNLE